MLSQREEKVVDPYKPAEDYIRRVHNLGSWPSDTGSRRAMQLVSPLTSLEEAKILAEIMRKRDPANSRAIELVASRAISGQYRICITLSHIRLPYENKVIDEKLMDEVVAFLNKHHAPFGVEAWRVNNKFGILYESPTIIFCEYNSEDTSKHEHAEAVRNQLRNGFEKAMEGLDISPELVQGFKQNLNSYDSKSSGHLHHLKQSYLMNLAIAISGMQQREEVKARSIFSGISSPEAAKKAKVASELKL